MKRTRPWFLLIVAVCLLLSALNATALPADQGLRDHERQALDVEAHQAFQQGGKGALETLIARYNLRRVLPSEKALTGLYDVIEQSRGSNLQTTWVEVYRAASGQYYVAAHWNWKDGAWNYRNGTYETVAIHFVTLDGARPQAVAWATNTGRAQIWANDPGIQCNQGWVHKYDIAGAGIIFTFQDHTNLLWTHMCGDSGLITAWLDQSPAPPYYAGFSYEHTWDGGQFKDAAIGFDTGKAGMALNVRYESVPGRWQVQSMRRYDANP